MYNSEMPNRADLPSKRKLIRSTVVAAASASVLLVTVILPAEYAVDLTGIGRVLGLTEMGQIKQQLANEAEKVEVAVPSKASIPEVTKPESVEDVAPVVPTESLWSDESIVTIRPREAAEVKLVMKKGDTAQYEWVTDQGHLNSDLHTDDVEGKVYSYKQGRSETDSSGDLTAVSDGAHGWYWRNRSDKNVTVTLRVKGQYSEIKRIM